jgi:tape measure domain-containing protein
VAKYTADIEIAVRGAAQVDGLIKNLNRLNNSINVVNRNAKLLEGKGFNVASMENYSRAVFKAENALRKAAQETRQEERAVRSLVSAMEIENKARARRNFLIAQEVANRRQVTATANAGFGLQGPQAANIRAGRGPASPLRGTANMPGSPAALAATTAGGGLARGAGGGMAGRLGQALSSALIGGGFPLLFGQGAGAAVGGGLGGLAGGALGGGLGFGLSIVGTLLGDIASRGQAVKQLGQDLGFSAQQAQALASAFKTANTDVETFTAVIQNIRGLGLELEDQAELIKLTTTLTEKYGGQFDKVGNAITSALESGKVSQATLNQLTSQGINIQQALADKLGVSRDRLLEMAKKGQISVQDLVDTLVDVGNKGAQAVKKPATGIEMLGKASKDLGKAIGDLGGAIVKSLTPPFNWLAARLSGIISLAAQGIQGIANLLSGGTQSTAIANARARKLLFEETGGAAPMRGNLTVAQTARLRILETQQQKVVAAAETKIKPIDVRGLGQAAPSGGGSDKAAKDAARLAQQLQEQLRSAKDLVTKKQAELNLTKAISEEDKLKGKYEATRTERMQNYVKLLNKSLSDAERASLVEAQTLDIQISRMEYEKELSVIRKQQVEDLYAMLGVSNLLNLNFERMASFVGAGKPGLAFNPNMNLVPSLTGGELGGKAEQARLELEKLIAPAEQLASVAEGIGSAFANSFKGVASGAMTAQEALSAFFQTVADRFLDMAAQVISKWIEMTILNSVLSLFPGGTMFKGAGPVSGAAAFSGAGMGAKGFLLPQILPGRAAGGPVSAGSPYIVGERGPELFVPGRSGGIVPNDSLGMGSANVVVNVDASGSNVQGDGNQASQLGKAIGIAVQQELIKQKRPGGLLA